MSFRMNEIGLVVPVTIPDSRRLRDGLGIGEGNSSIKWFANGPRGRNLQVVRALGEKRKEISCEFSG